MAALRVQAAAQAQAVRPLELAAPQAQAARPLELAAGLAPEVR
jgi:hypothetical protein